MDEDYGILSGEALERADKVTGIAIALALIIAGVGAVIVMFRDLFQ